VVVVFLMIAILVAVKWNLNMVLICILLWPGMVLFHVFFSHLDFFL
jgi:hypothetical protein